MPPDSGGFFSRCQGGDDRTITYYSGRNADEERIRLLATIFRTLKKREDSQTGKRINVLGPDGQPLMYPKWRTVVFDHTGKRKAFTLATGKRESQRQANMLEAREREIRNGLRPKPDKTSRLFNDVLLEYMTWGRAQGGRRGLPWAVEYATHKERDLIMWRGILDLERIGDAKDILARVESECHKLLAMGSSGKTVWNKVQNFHAMLIWCVKRDYLCDNPLAALGKLDIEPTFIRRAMTVDEYRRLLSFCALHRHLLYETAACSGLRENELRALEPRHLDCVGMALRVDRRIDKGRRKRLQPIPESLVERLVAFSCHVMEKRSGFMPSYTGIKENDKGENYCLRIRCCMYRTIQPQC